MIAKVFIGTDIEPSIDEGIGQKSISFFDGLLNTDEDVSIRIYTYRNIFLYVYTHIKQQEIH
jgi:hypothetical protein